MIPTKKISLTLIEYAEPLIQDLPEAYSQCDLEGVLKLAALVWNACVLDQWHSTTENVEAVRRQISLVAKPVPVGLIEALILRKQQMFGMDPRAITNECVVVKNGEFVVRAEARLDVRDAPMKGGIVN
jgi:hypothetical protein